MVRKKALVLTALLVFILVGCDTGLSKDQTNNYNVILLVLDTLAATHLNLYNYPRNTAPFLKKYGEQNIVFTNAFANGGYTYPSHFAIFTGVYPITSKMISQDRPEKLNPSIKTLPELLKEVGYETAWFAPSKTPFLPLDRGLGKGIDFIQPSGIFFPEDIDNIISWISIKKKSKFFAFCHSYIVHDPYTPPAPLHKLFAPPMKVEFPIERSQYVKMAQRKFKTKSHSFDYFVSQENSGAWEKSIYWDKINLKDPLIVNLLKNLYDGEIYYLDQLLKELFNRLDKLNILEKTIVIITADHGEAFGEHGYFHHVTLYDENIHVPFIIHVPGYSSKRFDSIIQGIDIVPTVLDLLNLPIPSYIEGKSLGPLLKGNKLSLHQYTYSIHHLDKTSLRSLEWKLIFNLSEYEFYDLKNDPLETNNLSINHEKAEPLKQKLDSLYLKLYQN